MTLSSRWWARFLVIILCFSTFESLYSKEKDRAWKDGVLLDTRTDRGTRVAPTTYGEVSLRDDITYYQIDDGKVVYVVARSLRNRRDRALDVTINGHVQFAIEGNVCYLQDAEGKEHKLSVEKRIAK